MLCVFLSYIFFFVANSLGTHFDEIAVGSLINVTIQEGKTAYFDCKINLLQDKTVSIKVVADFAKKISTHNAPIEHNKETK